jgi:hypothetical protein
MSEPATADFEVHGTVNDASDESLAAIEDWLASVPRSISIGRASIDGVAFRQSHSGGGFFFRMERGLRRPTDANQT